MTNAIIDCRSTLEYQQGHHKDAANIEADELFDRMHELPSKHSPITLYCCKSSINTACEFFERKGYKLTSVQLWSDSVQTKLLEQQLLTTGNHSNILWQPANIVSHFQTQLYPTLNNIQGRKALDIGCGAGRDSVYLAQHGWQVHAIDKNTDAIKRTQQLAMRQKVTITQTQTSIADFITQHFEQYDLIVVVRFLHRPLFNWIANALKPGGIVIFQTFLDGCQAIGQPKNPNFILQKHELRETFAAMDILLDEVEYLSDGRPLSAFIAQKKALND